MNLFKKTVLLFTLSSLVVSSLTACETTDKNSGLSQYGDNKSKTETKRLSLSPEAQTGISTVSYVPPQASLPMTSKVNGDKKGIVYVFFSITCPHCHNFIPSIIKTMDDRNIKYQLVELSANPELKESFGITSWPAFVYQDQEGKRTPYLLDVKNADVQKVMNEQAWDTEDGIRFYAYSVLRWYENIKK